MKQCITFLLSLSLICPSYIFAGGPGDIEAAIPLEETLIQVTGVSVDPVSSVSNQDKAEALRYYRKLLSAIGTAEDLYGESGIMSSELGYDRLEGDFCEREGKTSNLDWKSAKNNLRFISDVIENPNTLTQLPPGLDANVRAFLKNSNHFFKPLPNTAEANRCISNYMAASVFIIVAAMALTTIGLAQDPTCPNGYHKEDRGGEDDDSFRCVNNADGETTTGHTYETPEKSQNNVIIAEMFWASLGALLVVGGLIAYVNTNTVPQVRQNYSAVQVRHNANKILSKLHLHKNGELILDHFLTALMQSFVWNRDHRLNTTALHLAAALGHAEVVTALTQKDFKSASVRDSYKNLPSQLADFMGNRQIAGFLLNLESLSH